MKGRQILVLLALVFCHLQPNAQTQAPKLTEAKPIPEPVSNNAVTQGIVNDTSYVYSFAGIDSTKGHSGMHLKSWRYNTVANTWQQIHSLPDTMGKIAAAASTIGDTIFIIGGYHVFADESETSSNRIHRYDIRSGSYISDGANVPVPIDDHVQCVWRDSLIYVITGWSNTGNVANVQIYNPYNDSWQQGTPVPNNTDYKVFGASGTILGDTIYYFGGAEEGFNFPISNVLRKGIIHPQQPDSITWSDTVLQSNLTGYRTAATTVEDTIFWLGGSRTTYNFDGIAYDGSGGVVPADQLFAYVPSTGRWWVDTLDLPMDLRGVSATRAGDRYLVGGMVDSQQVTDEVLKLSWEIPLSTDDLIHGFQDDNAFQVYPNPASNKLNIQVNEHADRLTLYNLTGQKVYQKRHVQKGTVSMDVDDLTPGVYLLRVEANKKSAEHKKIVIQK